MHIQDLLVLCALLMLIQRISGERALLVSSEPPDVVKGKLEGYRVVDFSKSGNLATETILLKVRLVYFVSERSTYLLYVPWYIADVIDAALSVMLLINLTAG